MTQTKTAKNAVTSAYAVKRSYGYDRTGNLTRSTDQRTGTTHFEYDRLGRITKAGSERFAFDPAHNILSDHDSPTVQDNRLKEYNGTTYYYDHFGNLIHRELADGEVQNYFYDLHDQPVKAEIFKKDGSKETWAYTYDALGRRIGKGRLKNEEVSDGLEEETGFVWDGSHLLQEVHPDGRYTYLYTDPDSYEPLAQVRNWTTEDGESRQQIHYFHCDQIGIPREMTDKDGNLVWFGDYYGWGKLRSETNVTGTAHQPFRLQNQYCDRETGLHYNFFRYYEPDAGRFVNQDPIGLEGGENLYWFASNITSWIDPLGLESILVFLTKVSAKQNTGAVSFLNVNGRIYKGVSGKVPKKLHPELKKALNKIESSVPNIPGWHGKCAEVAAINKALKKGEKLDGATIETLNLAKDNRFGKPKHACTTCNPLLAMFRITATSG